MAEAVLFSTAEGILNSLRSLLLQEIGMIWSVKDELEKLKNTVSTIQSVLLDAEEQQPKSRAIKDWLGKLKDAMDDADNLLDDLSAEVLRREVMTRNKKAKEVRMFFSKSNQLAYGFKMSHEIRALRDRLEAIASDRIKFHFTESYTEMRFDYKEREHTHSFVRQGEVIGREDDKKAIVELLMDLNVKENVSIIPIVGIGGLGKTTLAQCVFGDEEVKQHFDLRMWVHVSESFDVKAIVKKIIESATKKRPENLEMDSLQNWLREEIDGKRYFLVLDDVWNENHDRWISLNNLLMGGKEGSKILITTRSTIVGQITSTISPYLLRGLSEENSWNLFKRMAFKYQEVPKPTLEDMGREIVKKCAQVPLAIRTIGSLLYFKNLEADWLYFKDSELSQIDQPKNGILPILKLSCDHLPSNLKQCFAFCSLFPKYHEIEVDLLIKMWIAGGFIHSFSTNQCLEDVGREYFMYLLSRSFFQDIEKDLRGNIRICKMHSLIHDLAQSIAGDECIIGKPKAENIVERTRYVAFELDSLLDIPSPLLKARKMRTFLLPRPTWQLGVLNPPIFDNLISSFKYLRVLNLSNSMIQRVPNSIGKLKHLRYLDLSWNFGIQVLPSSITQLLHLQTLRLEFCRELKELPKDTRNLINLRHLELYGCKSLTHMPNGLRELKCLQTLSLYVLQKEKGVVPKESGGLSNLNGLNGLKEILCIKGLEHLRCFEQEAKAANLKKKQFIQTLVLEWKPKGLNGDRETLNDELLLENLQPHLNLEALHLSGYEGVRLSSWVPLLSNLYSIILENCKWCECIPPLDRFPSLQYLCLNGLSSLEYIGDDCSNQSTSSLKVLILESLPNLKGWCKMGELVMTDPEHHHHLLSLPSFPSLTDLFISNCPKISALSIMMSMPTPWSETAVPSSSFSTLPKLQWLSIRCMEELESLPEWIGDLRSLRTLEIVKCPNLISLPEGISRLTTLRKLAIAECPHLQERCEEGRGEDWPKIAHVPNLRNWQLWFPKLP